MKLHYAALRKDMFLYQDVLYTHLFKRKGYLVWLGAGGVSSLPGGVGGVSGTEVDRLRGSPPSWRTAGVSYRCRVVVFFKGSWYSAVVRRRSRFISRDFIRCSWAPCFLHVVLLLSQLAELRRRRVHTVTSAGYHFDRRRLELIGPVRLHTLGRNSAQSGREAFPVHFPAFTYVYFFPRVALKLTIKSSSGGV